MTQENGGPVRNQRRIALTLGLAVITWAVTFVTAEAAPPAHAGGLPACRENLGRCEADLGVLEEEIAALTAANAALAAQLGGCTQDKAEIAGQLETCTADLAECEGQEPPPAECPVSAGYAAPILTAQTVETSGGAVAGTGELPSSTATLKDYVRLELYPGIGVFEEGLRTGTFTIAGEDLNYATCAICPRMFGDCSEVTGECSTQFYATGGTVTISQVQGSLAFDLTNVQFVEVTIDDGTFVSTPVPDGCSSTISSASFDAPIMP